MATPRNTSIHEYHLNQYQPDKPQFAVYDLADYLQKNRAKATKPHIHSFYQMAWFKTGTGKHYVDFKEYDVVENTLFFIAKNQVHYFDQTTDYEGALIHFNAHFLMQKDSDVDFFLQCNLFNNPYQQPSCGIDGGIESLLNEYLRLMQQELQHEPKFAQADLLRAYLKAFLIQIQRRRNELDPIESQFPVLVDEKRMQLIRFINLLDEYYTKGLTVAEYAQLMHISTRTLSDLTHQLLNKTPSLMIQERIILEAQRLLIHSSLNVNQIGYRLGFDDPSYFVKYFKKHTRQSPTDFRKAIA